MKITPFLLLLCGSLVWGRILPPPAAAYDFENPPQGIFVDDWMEVYLAGQKAGYMNTQFRREGEVVHTRTYSYLRMGRGGFSVEMEMLETTRETIDGKPLAVLNRILAGSLPIEMSGTVKGAMIHLRMKQGEQIQESAVPLPEGVKLVWGMAREGFMRGMEPGTTYSMAFYSPDVALDKPLKAQVKVVGKEQVDCLGEEVEALRVETSLSADAAGIKMVSWVDTSQRVLKMQFFEGGLPMEMYLSDRGTALTDFETAEMFNLTLITLDKAIVPTAREVVYSIRSQGDASLLGRLPELDFQHVAPAEEGICVTVTKADHSRFDASLPDTYPEALTPYLSSSLTLKLEDPELQKLLQESGALEEKRATARADLLRRFVSQFIEEKGLSVGFATASEICRKPEGDCTEHAVLLAALGRAAGIPTRVVSGLAYLPTYGEWRNVMGYHMWTQFYIDGCWVDFDAALEESECSPTRLALAASALGDDALSEIGFALWDVIGMLEVSVLSVSEER